jgi:hypothetical protein
MSHEEAQEYLRRDPRNAEVVFPYLNGKDLNSSPRQEPSRWVINFHDWPLEKAAEFPELLAVVREKVKPERDKLTRECRRLHWWRHGEHAPNLYRAIAPLKRVLVKAVVSNTHALARVPVGQVFAHKLVVFATDQVHFLTVLQSLLHEAWARRCSSTLRTDTNYSPSDCFETFPFPRLTDAMRARLDAIGETYHEHRRQVMLRNNEGLTATYNRFHDPQCKDPDIVELRRLHVEMDLAVRDAYGWSDLDLGHGWRETRTTEEKKDARTGMVRTVEKVDWQFAISDAARKELLHRLLKLNHERHEEEEKARTAADQAAAASRKAKKSGAGKAEPAGGEDDKPFRLTNPVDPKKGKRLPGM